MRKLYFIIGLVFCSLVNKAQSFSDTAILLLKKNTLFSKLALEPAFVSKQIFKGWKEEKENPLGATTYVDGFQNSCIKCKLALNDKEPSYRLVVNVKNDTIFYAEVAAYDLSSKNNNESKPIYLKVDTIILYEYIFKHNQRYHAIWTIDDFLYPKKESLSYGFVCEGYFPTVADNAKKLAILVKKKDHQKLRHLASSFSPYQRAAGTVGLFFLQMAGERLSSEEIQIIKTNQNSNEVIFNCESNIYPGEQLSQLLTEQKLMELYKKFESYKLL